MAQSCIGISLDMQMFVNEVFKIKNGLSLEIASETFVRETGSHFVLKPRNGFRIPPIHTVYFSSRSKIHKKYKKI